MVDAAKVDAAKVAAGQDDVAVGKMATVALVGNPNTGKTTLFNRLTGLRAKTANYPGITVDVRKGTISLKGGTAELVDLPGMYSLRTASPEEQLAREVLLGVIKDTPQPDAVVLVLDATQLERNLMLASEILDLKLPTVVAINLIDAAESSSIKIQVDKLAAELKCPVVLVSARKSTGLNELCNTIDSVLTKKLPLLLEQHTSCTMGCSGCTFAARFDWAEKVCNSSVDRPPQTGRRVAKLDQLLTHPVIGVMAFLTVMLAVFYLIFSLASIPMDLVDGGFATLGDYVGGLIPDAVTNQALWFAGAASLSMLVFAVSYWAAEIYWSLKNGLIAIAVSVFVAMLPVDDFRSLVVDGVIGGIGGVLVFLPQICILFFFISLLEDTGYMARAAFVMERLMRFVGLPGKAFVPMLSAHACAIPGIMAARVIENWRDRLVTILVLPLLTCSARLPVYSMITALLFSDSPVTAALVFVAAYVLGIAAALFSAWCLKKTILKGDTVPLVIELPAYRRPSFSGALAIVVERGINFVGTAGTAILLISVILWALATYPKMPEAALPQNIAEQVTSLRSDALTAAEPEPILAEADRLIAQESLAYSCAGRVGRLLEPVFAPLGFDWKINVGVITSFAAREVVVSTLAIVYGIGEDGAEDKDTLVDTLRRQKRPDGTPVFTLATGMSLLVFFVLAMQCLPTQAVTKRETGSWKWAIFQLVYMTAMAYVAAFVTFQVISRSGWN